MDNDEADAVTGAAPAEAAEEETGADGLQAKIAEAMDAGGAAEEAAAAAEPGPDAAGQEEDADPELEEGKLKPGEVQGLSPQAQAKVNERIHELNVKRKDAEAKAAAAEAKTSELEKRDTEVMRDALRLGLAPEYVSKAEVADLKRYESLRQEKRWLTQHRDGYEGTDKDGDIVLTAGDVATREADLEDELSDLAPRMKALLRERTGQMLTDMGLGRNIRLRAGSKTGKLAPSALPGGGKTQLKKPAPGKAGTMITPENFRQRGANRRALEEMFESRM